jgi:hypothetical protein
MSTKTGWALVVSEKDAYFLEEYGQVPQMPEPPGQYPSNYIDWAYALYGKVVELVDRLAPDVLVIEETASGSKNIYSQKILEWLHFLVAKMIKESKMRVVYLMTEQWRRDTGCVMSKEEKKKNKQVREYKKSHDVSIAYDKDGKRIGLVGRKHVNVRRANEVFGQFLREPLRKKDEDTADSLMLAYAYHLRRMKTV